MKKAPFAFLLALALTLGLLTPLGAAEAATVSEGTVLLAFNPRMTGTSLTFTPALPDCPPLPEPIAISVPEEPPVRREVTPYAVGDTKTGYDDARPGEKTFPLVCVAVGETCTIWTGGEGESARLPQEEAAVLAAAIDEILPQELTLFGDWLDVDGDGKVAFLFYDIADTMNTGLSSGVLGIFRSNSLLAPRIDPDGSVLGVLPVMGGTKRLNYRVPDADSCLGMDCLHIETASGLTPDDFTDPAVRQEHLQTAVHEFQHLINFTWTIQNYDGTNYGIMEPLLDEGLARSAEFQIYGTAASEPLANYYRSSITPGLGLVNWTGAWSQYLLSFLLVEYMRTAYARTLDPANGGLGFYRWLQREVRVKNMSASADTLGLVTTALGYADKAELFRKFWIALYTQGEGELGYNGEAWALSFLPQLETLTAAPGAVQPSGARFFRLPAGDIDIAGNDGLELIPLGEAQGVLATGTYGDSATWTLLRNGEMRVEGAGEMHNFITSGYLSDIPWFSYRKQLYRLTFSEGITGVGLEAFDGSALEEIVFPESLERIGHFAFQSCTKLRQVTIPAGVSLIGQGAFRDCTALETVRFMGENVFDYNLMGVEQNNRTFPAAVTLTYLSGLDGWILDQDYDPEAATWRGYALRPWGNLLYLAPGTGAGTTETLAVPLDEEFFLPDCPFTAPEGEVFLGWQQGEERLPAGSPLTLEAPATLTAQWGKRLTLLPGEGAGEALTLEGLTGESLTLPDCPFTPPKDMVFVGWGAGETVYPAGSPFPLTDHAALTAQWALPPVPTALSLTCGLDEEGLTWRLGVPTGTALHLIAAQYDDFGRFLGLRLVRLAPEEGGWSTGSLPLDTAQGWTVFLLDEMTGIPQIEALQLAANGL